MFPMGGTHLPSSVFPWLGLGSCSHSLWVHSSIIFKVSVYSYEFQVITVLIHGTDELPSHFEDVVPCPMSQTIQ
jgi:hypothetical protein